MMKVLVVLLLVGATLAKKSYLTAVLRSRNETQKLYKHFKLQQHLSFTLREDALRFKLFKESAEFVERANAVEGETAEFGLNFFSTMTEEEKKLYSGINVTGVKPNPRPRLQSTPASLPKEKMWLSEEEGAVTPVSNQGGCGSCWAYSAVAAVETQYKIASGVLRKFSEQEYLDCTYEKHRGYDGCWGGWMKNAFEYSIKSGRLASAADYPYLAYDDHCRAPWRDNSLVAATITKYVKIPGTEEANIEALSKNAISVALQTTNRFHAYQRGILMDATGCWHDPTHAITLVGYTPEYVLGKNSWGKEWGEKGFVKFARNHHNCHLWLYSVYPVMTKTKNIDEKASDPKTDYNPKDTEPTPDCKDKSEKCQLHWCDEDYIRYDMCRRTCHYCDDEEKKKDEECPGGTTMCADGVCRHEHMC